MTDETILRWLPYAFPFFFIGMWFAITTLLGLMSGWFNLQQWYPDDGSEDPLLKLGGQSGSMGIGVALNGCLKLRAYRSGLGVGIWRIFGPFQKPLRIPWAEITAEPSRTFFTPMMKLSLGGEGRLRISARSWSKLVEAAGGAAGPSLSATAVPVSSRSLAQRMALEWLVFTLAAATFFYVVPRVMWGAPGLPVEICLGFPAVVFGIGQLVRFARET